MNVTETIVIAAAPDAVWAVGGDVGTVADWIPALEASHLEGDVRHATFAGGGGEATERIVERDDSARAYVYVYVTGPLPLQSYRSRFAVQEHPQGSEIVWTADLTTGDATADPDLATAIAGIYSAGLEELRRKLEG